MASIVLIGTLDTKGVEYAFVRQRIEALGHDVLLIDAGVMGEPDPGADISRNMVAGAVGAKIADLAAAGDRGAAVTVLSEGARKILLSLHAEGRVHGVAALGGSGGSSLAAHAMQALPIGVPKLIVSTVASGDTRVYVGATDITMMHSVVDVAGINSISRRILSNAAAAIAGMAADFMATPAAQNADKPLIAATMFGVTTPCVMAAKARLEEHGFEVLVFHAVGTGGQSMEALVAGGFIAGVLDATTTELADKLVGGVFPAGKDRLTVAGKAGVPQVVSLGALDMVNFGALDTVPERFRNRNLYVHNASITLMRTTPEECSALGSEIAQKLSVAKGPVALFVPRKGVSAIAVRGGVFDDAEADAALFGAVTSGLTGTVAVHDLDYDINDERFAHAMADALANMIRERAGTGRGTHA